MTRMRSGSTQTRSFGALVTDAGAVLGTSARRNAARLASLSAEGVTAPAR
ncbi:MAG: hypothetical protein HYZ28_22740 [Myxococcales bacterium]|nr:hypothetical protein [Myxococcales bacterium]